MPDIIEICINYSGKAQEELKQIKTKFSKNEVFCKLTLNVTDEFYTEKGDE